MPDAGVATDLDLAADVGCDLAAEVTLDLEVRFDVVPERDDLVVGELAGALVDVDPGGLERLDGASPADAEDVRERDLHPLLAGEVDAD